MSCESWESFFFFFFLFLFAAYTLDELEKKSEALRAATYNKTPDDAPPIDVSVTCHCVSDLGVHFRVPCFILFLQNAKCCVNFL